MKVISFLAAFWMIGAALGHAQEQPAQQSVTAQLKWVTDKVFEIPESVIYDSARDVIYVSNVNGVPLQLDMNGYISRVKTDGTVEQLKWVTGLSAPKGMGILGDRLYVADIYRLVEIDIPLGKIVNSYNLKAQFLNDVAIDAAGVVYISDNMANRIYRLKDGVGEIWSEGALGGPNGLTIEPSGLLVNSMADGVVRMFGWDGGKPVDRVRLKVGLDGIEPYHGGYLVSVFDGEVYWVPPDSPPVAVVDTRDKNMQAADIGYIPNLNLLLVPTFSDNRLCAYQLTLE